MKWRVDRCEPSDGSKVCFTKVDHRAELYCEDRSTFMLIQCGSYGITNDEFVALCNKMAEGLSCE